MAGGGRSASAATTIRARYLPIGFVVNRRICCGIGMEVLVIRGGMANSSIKDVRVAIVARMYEASVCMNLSEISMKCLEGGLSPRDHHVCSV